MVVIDGQVGQGGQDGQAIVPTVATLLAICQLLAASQPHMK